MFQVVPVLPGTVRTGILEGLAPGTCWDVPSGPTLLGTIKTLEGLASGTCWEVQVDPAVLGTVGILEGLAPGTCCDVPSSPSASWNCRDWHFRESSPWNLLGCPK